MIYQRILRRLRAEKEEVERIILYDHSSVLDYAHYQNLVGRLLGIVTAIGICQVEFKEEIDDSTV